MLPREVLFIGGLQMAHIPVQHDDGGADDPLAELGTGDDALRHPLVHVGQRAVGGRWHMAIDMSQLGGVRGLVGLQHRASIIFAP